MAKNRLSLRRLHFRQTEGDCSVCKVANSPSAELRLSHQT
jgi:hypothetical protein